MYQRVTRNCVVELFSEDGRCLKCSFVSSSEEYENDRNNRVHKSKIPKAVVSAKSLQHKLLSSLSRCEFLLRRIHEGDHQALENAHDASEEAKEILSTIDLEEFGIHE